MYAWLIFASELQLEQLDYVWSGGHGGSGLIVDLMILAVLSNISDSMILRNKWNCSAVVEVQSHLILERHLLAIKECVLKKIITVNQ